MYAAVVLELTRRLNCLIGDHYSNAPDLARLSRTERRAIVAYVLVVSDSPYNFVSDRLL
jgi:hypothetical protein